MKLQLLIFLATFFLLTFCGLRIKNMRLVDDQDRELLLHGGCVVYKVPPYFPKTDAFDYQLSFTDRDVEIYKELGMNGVRLGAMYPSSYLGGQECNLRKMSTTKPTCNKWSS